MLPQTGTATRTEPDAATRIPRDSLSALGCVLIASPDPSRDALSLCSRVRAPESPSRHLAVAESFFDLPACRTERRSPVSGERLPSTPQTLRR